MTSTDLAGTTALVTGATSGIGRAVAVSLARRGAHVLASGRDPARSDAVIAEIRAAGGKADFIAADLADAASVRALARQATELGGGQRRHPRQQRRRLPVRPDPRRPRRGHRHGQRRQRQGALHPDRRARVGHGGPRQGLDRQRADDGGSPRRGWHALYGSSKAALTLFTKAWAAEFGPDGVRVNAVSPGPTRTEGTEVMGDQLDQLASLAPAGRPAAPEEIASAISYLAGDEASFVHGAVLDVDGGRHAA